MSYDESLVGSLSLVIAFVFVGIAIGRWRAPYELHSIASVQERFGSTAARGVWLALAIASFTAGLAILSGVRPGYADPFNAEPDSSNPSMNVFSQR